MCHRGHPAEQRSAPAVGRKQLVSAMAHGIAQNHVRGENQKRSRMNGQHQQDERQVDGIHDRFAGVKAVGGERRGNVRPVVQAVKPQEQWRMIQKAV